jgi:hypothetical protein
MTTKTFGAFGPTLRRDGWNVIPVKGKKPIIEGWQKGFTPQQVDRLAANGHANSNIGLLARTFPGVDIDVSDEQCASAIEALALRMLGSAPIRIGTAPKRLLAYTTDAPFSKVKVYLEGPNGPIDENGKDYAVEILGDGQQYVIYGRHPDGHEYTWPNNDGPGDTDAWDLTPITLDNVTKFVDAIPRYLPEGWSVRENTGGRQVVVGDADEMALANYRAPLDGWDLDRFCSEILPHLDPDCSYEDWIRVGAAMHHQGQGAEDWLEAWDSWSANSGKYAEGLCSQKWDSFHGQRGQGVTTIASLIKKTGEARKQAEKVERDSLVKQTLRDIEACQDARDLQDQVCARIANSPAFSDVEREQLAAKIQAKGKDLGVKLPIATIRGWLRNRTSQSNTPAPEWAKPWVYVTDCDKFFSLESKEEVTPQGFRAVFNRFMPVNQDGNRERADVWALEMWDIPAVAHKAYMPGVGPIFEMFGMKWVNLYRPESVPTIPTDYSDADLAAIETVKGHLETYLADARERELLLSWLAHNVRHPGKKIRWAPYIHGVPGDGKSFFAALVGVAMGGQNVRSLNGSTLESNFTDWASGYALVAIEEMKQHGHNRFDIMNRLKPYITNSEVEIHPKGRASYTAPNVSNYMIFSNYLDGAPVDEGDRRYMFLSSQLTTEDAKRLTEANYFGKLFDAVREHPGAIRKWLLEYEPHPEFDADGRAPDTAIKATVIEMSKSDLELVIEDLIEQGAEGVSKDVISSAHLTRAMSARSNDVPSTTRVNTMLTKLGYRFAKRIKWKGEACRVWLRQGVRMPDEKLRDALDATTSVTDDFLQ